MNLIRVKIFLVVFIIIIASFFGAVFGFLAGMFSNDLAGNHFISSIPFVQQKLEINRRANLQVEENQEDAVYNIVEESSTIEAVKKVSPAVVSILVTKDLSSLGGATGQPPFSFNDFFEFGFPFNFDFQTPEGKQEIGGGTGFVVDADKGLIVTNKHVVADIEAQYSVLTNEGERYEAEVLARDPFNDIAILKVEPNSLPAVELGDSDLLEIGQTVVAIGNALGEYRNTVTRGVVSGINREIIAGSRLGSEKLENIIQTDAAINPGNSGGPLINLAGQVVGINTAIDRSGQSVGFAIPINEAKQVIDSVEKYGRIIRPYLGVRYVLINEQIAKNNNLNIDYGALILRGEQQTDLAVMPGSPADKAGLQENDIILEIDGKKVTTENTLAKAIQQYYPEDEIKLLILSKGEEKEIKVVLTEFVAQ